MMDAVFGALPIRVKSLNHSIVQVLNSFLEFRKSFVVVLKRHFQLLDGGRDRWGVKMDRG